jgi:hypothetical protein
MPTKLEYAQNMQRAITQIAQAADVGVNLCDIFTDRRYGTTDVITDEDVATLHIKAVDVSWGITFFENLTKLLGAVATVQYDFDGVLNRLRNDI